MSPSLLNNSNLSDIHRLREDFASKHLSTPWEDQILQATKACEVWKSEADESNRKVGISKTYIFENYIVAASQTPDDWRIWFENILRMFTQNTKIKSF